MQYSLPTISAPAPFPQRPKRSFVKTVLLAGLLLAAAVCLFESRGSAAPIAGAAAIGNRTATEVRFAEHAHEDAYETPAAPSKSRRRRGTGPVAFQPTHLLTWMLSFNQFTPQQEAFDALANEFAEETDSAHEEHDFTHESTDFFAHENVGALITRPGALRATPGPTPVVSPNGLQREEGCHTAVEEEACYEHVAWAMATGIKEHPEKYGHLTEWSSFREFQAAIAPDHESCSSPCWGWEGKECHTAEIGEECYTHVGTAMRDRRFPSTFEEMQEQLRTEGDVTCAPPCFKTLASRARAVKDRAITKAKGLLESTRESMGLDIAVDI